MTINDDAKEYGKKFLENEFQYLEISNGGIERLVEKSYKAGADAERKKYETALSALSEYLNLLKQDRKLFKLTLTGEDEPEPTKYMAIWMANAIKLRLSEEKLIKIFGIHTKGE